MKKIIGLLMLLVALPAAAANLDVAKAAGIVGERNDGYIGFVISDPDEDVVALVRDINEKRRAKFEEVAEESGATLEQVHIRFYRRAVELTQPGHYYMDSAGNWRRK